MSPWLSLSLSGFLHKFHCQQYSHQFQYYGPQSESSYSQQSGYCHRNNEQSHDQAQRQQCGPNYLMRFPEISCTKYQRSALHVRSKPVKITKTLLLNLIAPNKQTSVQAAGGGGGGGGGDTNFATPNKKAMYHQVLYSSSSCTCMECSPVKMCQQPAILPLSVNFLPLGLH